MPRPTPNEETLANRIIDALALLGDNGATQEEREYYVAETISEYRQTLLPHGRRREERATNYDPPYQKHWKHAEKLLKDGKTLEARKYIQSNVTKEHLLPNSRLVIKVMLALLKDEDVVSWAHPDGGT